MAPSKYRLPLDPWARIPACLLLLGIFVTWFIGWGWISWIFVILFIIVVGFFRDPPRFAPTTAGMIVSPADGRVVAIRTNTDPDAGPVGGPCVVIFLSVLNVHINRAAYEGEVEAIRYQPGEFLNALDEASSERNESNWIYLKCGSRRITIRQIAGLIARRIICRVREGQQLYRGQRIGLIRFGSRTELYLPPEVRMKVEVGQKVRGGVSVIAVMPD